MIALFGERETGSGFVNYTTDLKHAVGNDGVVRPWTHDPQRPPGIEDQSASDICIRLAPLKRITLDEMERIALPGCRVTIALPTGPDDNRPGGMNTQLQAFRDRFPTRTTLFDDVHFGVTDVGTPMVWKVIVAELPRQTSSSSKATVTTMPFPAPSIAPVIEAPRSQFHDITNSIGMIFRRVPTGMIRRGSTEKEGRFHEVKVTRPFSLGIYPVTQEQYENVMGRNPSYFSSTGCGKDRVRGMDTRAFPVEQVSWHDARAFVECLASLPQEKEAGRYYRLPREAEWEHSCRGGVSDQPFHLGNSLSSWQANFDGRYPYGGVELGPFLERTCQVGSYPANGFGLFDMHGNVYEWCQDWADEGCAADSADEVPPAPPEGSIRGIRGGGWNDSGDCCGTISRNGIAPSNRGYDLGFRVVLVPRDQE